MFVNHFITMANYRKLLSNSIVQKIIKRARGKKAWGYMTFCEDKGVFSRCFATLKTNPKQVYWKRTKEGALGLIIHISRGIENMQISFYIGNGCSNEKSSPVLI